MLYRPFGKTGVQVSALGFGAMRLPAREDKQVDLEKSVPLLRRGLDLGINYIDTAYGYIDGTSEIAVGQAIKTYDRSKIILATKIPVRSPEDGSEAAWRDKFDTCLKRFDSAYIDVIQFHGLSWPIFEQVISKPGMALAAARKAQAEGLVRYVSFSSHDEVGNIIKLIDTGEFNSLLVQYNYLDQHNEPVISYAAENGMGVAIMGPVAGGRLATPESVVPDACGVVGIKPPELALRFVWNNPNVSLALSGMNTMAQIEENAASANRIETMSESERSNVQMLFEKNQKFANLYCTGCAYCMPCPNGVNIPDNFRFMNWSRVWGMDRQAKEAYARMSADGFWAPWGQVKGLKASECLECGECEAKCPQNIHIMDQLKEVAQTFG